ncbi:MAG TPA: DUF4403 family protein [Chitinophagaceae bacterium]|nr:DUF4403 family protein [Chitinophagaceae bacterium]
MKFWLLSLAIMSPFFFLSCKSSRHVQAIPAVRSLPALPSSEINIPVKIIITDLLNQLNASTASRFTNTGWPAYSQPSCDFRYKYQFIRSPFSLSCSNNLVNLHFQGQYQIAGSRSICAFNKQVSPWVSGSCGFGTEPMRRVDINIRSLLQFLPQHALKTSTHIDSVNAIDKCQVTLMQNDLTAEVLDSIKASVNSYCDSFDSFVASLNNAPLLNKWRQGSSPVLNLGGYGYLNLNPGRLQIGPLNSMGDTLAFSLGFSGQPQLNSDSIQLISQQPLPPLQSLAVQPGFKAYLNLSYNYSYFNQLLNDSLYNKVFDIDGRTFVIRHLQVSGSDKGQLDIAMEFAGSKKGVLQLSGSPVLDSTQQVLSMSGLHVDINSRDMLLNMARNLIRKKILKELQGKSVLDIQALVQRNKAGISKRLSQPVNDWLQSYGALNNLRVLGILITKDNIQLQISIDGNLELMGRAPASLLSSM